MTCKDCLHYECCHNEIAYGMGSDDITGKYFTDIETRCKHFKNKADFTEVKRMQWIKKPHVSKEYKQCPVCKYDFSRLEPDNFCPNCGAKKEAANNV